MLIINSNLDKLHSEFEEAKNHGIGESCRPSAKSRTVQRFVMPLYLSYAFVALWTVSAG
jgi:hypothetical protein